MSNNRNHPILEQLFIGVSSLAICISCLSTASAEEEAYIARAVSVSGKVLVREAKAVGMQMNFLKPGDKLYKGSIVNTGSNGAVKLLLTDRTILDLGPSSLIKMNDYELNNVGDRKVDLSLDYGQVRASVNEKITSNKGKFTIRTKAATMGVRGTEFVVNSTMPTAAGTAAGEVPRTALTVMHGKVEVADENRPTAPPLAVTPGLQFAKEGAAAGAVAQLQPQQIAQVKSDAFQKDMTFIQTVAFDQTTSKGNSENRTSEGTSTNGGKEPPPANNSGKKTMESIAMNVETQAKESAKPQITDLKLPGTFTPEIPQSRPIDQLNGRFVNLKVRICVPGANGC